MKIAIYPGSFDPVTMGHRDIIERASALFDRLVVVVMHNVSKNPIFTAQERVRLLRQVTSHLQNVEVDSFGGLLADYAGRRGACTIVKGLRAMSDFENEFSMALANRKLNPNVDTAFLMTSAEYMYLSSSMVKDIALHGGTITDFVPAEIEEEILHRVRKDG